MKWSLALQVVALLVAGTAAVDDSSFSLFSRERKLMGDREGRQWRRTGTSVSSSISSSSGQRDSEPLQVASRLLSRPVGRPAARSDQLTPTGPPLDLSTTRRSLFNNNRHFGVPGTVISAPSMPPSARPPAERPTSSGLPPGQTHTWTGPHNTVRPILPPALPPSPKPPAIPEPPAPPRPPPRPTIQPFTGRPSTLSGEGQVTAISCVIGRFVGKLQAVLTLPSGYNALPLLHDRPSIDLFADSSCMIQTSAMDGEYELLLKDLEHCGVTECAEGDKLYLCVSIRFPALSGLQLPEDQVATIRCLPQDPTAEKTRGVNLATSQHVNSERETALFDGGGQVFECDITLYRFDPNTNKFSDRVLESTELDLGEEVELWSIVKPNDGWTHSRMVEVIVHRVDSSAGADGTPRNKAVLVFQDGCNNPLYSAIAPGRPTVNRMNDLINIFKFRVFLFQDMQPGESVVISAKVIGCVDEEDCREPTNCPNTAGRGRREIREASLSLSTTPITPQGGPLYPPLGTPLNYSPPPVLLHQNFLTNSTTNWSRSLAINVKRPASQVNRQQMSLPPCQIYLFLTVGVSVAFFLATVVFVIAILAKKRSQQRDQKKNNSSTPATSTSSISIKTQNPSNTVAKRNSHPMSFVNAFPNTTTEDSISEDSVEDESDEFSWLPPPQMLVPATVRQRKRELNNELLDTFRNGGAMTLPSCPALLNYYGYMVVPRTAAAAAPTYNTAPRKRNKSSHTTDKVQRATASDSEDLPQQQRAHKQRYKRRQRQYAGDKTRTASEERTKGKQEQSTHQIKINVPSPPVRPPYSKKQPYHENIYEVPIESRPIMV